MTGRAGGNGPGPRDAIPPSVRAPAPPPDLTQPPACGPLRRVVRIVNPFGLHQRVADRFSRTARTFSCTITVWNGDVQADGKSMTDLMMLIALPDAEVILEVDGPDAHAAVDPLTAILASPSGEDYTL